VAEVNIFFICRLCECISPFFQFFLLLSFPFSFLSPSFSILRLVGGAGIPAFYTASGVGTYVELGGMPIKHTATGKVDIVSEPRPTAVFSGTMRWGLDWVGLGWIGWRMRTFYYLIYSKFHFILFFFIFLRFIFSDFQAASSCWRNRLWATLR
jgi:hypothetical protein